MTYSIRYLDSDKDFHDAKEILSSHKKSMRTIMTRNNIELGKNDKLLGCFIGNNLIAFLKIYIFEQLPYYRVGNMNIRQGILSRYDFSNPNHPIIPMMNFILEEQEKEKRYTWYYNRSLTKAYHKLQLEGKDLLKNCTLGYDTVKKQYRYERFIEEVIGAGDQPKYIAHKSMQNKVFDTDYMIVKCCLKNEYRSTPNYFDDKIIEKCLKTTYTTKSI